MFKVKLINTVNTRSKSFFSTNPDRFGIFADERLKRFVLHDIKSERTREEVIKNHKVKKTI